VYLPLILKNYPELLLVFRDDFNDTTWDYPWGVLNEDPSLYSLTAHPGFLRIMTHPGRVGEKNLFEMWAPTGDFEIRTRLLFTPTSDFQVAGLVVSETRRNYLMLGRAHCDVPPPSCVGSGIYFERVEADQSLGSNFATSTTGQEEVYLRVVRQSSTYSGYYSEDGVNWTLVGSHTPSLELSMVGITAAQDFADIGIPADFDYFEVCSYSTPARTTTLTWTSTLSKAASRKCEADCFSLLDYLRSRESVSNWEPILACQRLHQIVVIGE
jgi:beta-xylosidase